MLLDASDEDDRRSRWFVGRIGDVEFWENQTTHLVKKMDGINGVINYFSTHYSLSYNY
jgi:hypothetical protein